MRNDQIERCAFGLNEAAKSVGVSIPTMRILVNRPDFPAFKSGKRWIIPVDCLKVWLADRAKEHAEL